MSGIFPTGFRGLAFTVLKRPEFSTIIQEAPNRYTLRLPQTRNPVWHWSLIYDHLKDFDIQLGETYTDMRRMMGFFLNHAGAAEDFLFSDSDDNYQGPALVSGAPNPLAELAVVTDGASSWFTPLQRNMGSFMEDVTDLDGSVTVYANGVLMDEGTDFTVEGPGLALPGKSYAGLYFAWATEPAAPVTAEFNFYFRVRFETDQQGFDKFVNQMWAIGGPEARESSELLLMTARPAYLAPEIVCLPPVVCPQTIPVPAPTPGLLRVIVGPRSCSSVDGSCGGATAACDPTGRLAGTGSAFRQHGSALGDPPVCYWSNFSLPSWLNASRVQYIYFVFGYNYVPAVKMAVAQAVMGYPFHDFSTSGEGSAVGVQGPVAEAFTGAFFSGMTASGGIAWTLDDPPGSCNPCGAGGADCYASLAMESVCLVVDYTP